MFDDLDYAIVVATVIALAWLRSRWNWVDDCNVWVSLYSFECIRVEGELKNRCTLPIYSTLNSIQSATIIRPVFELFL